MYNTMRELVQATRTIFATQKSVNGGRYGPLGNDVGCAIGCHFGADLQLQLDVPDYTVSVDNAWKIHKTGDGYGGNGIIGIMEDSPRRRDIIRRVIGEGISNDDLGWLQCAHDESHTLEGFIAILDQWLEEHPAPGLTHPLFTVPESHIMIVPEEALNV